VSRARRERRVIDGVLLLNKPTGITSQQAVARVRFLYAAAKAGHTGTLDPMADGLLPVCFGEATKFTHMLLDADKAYRARIRLGVVTTTGDAEGEVLHTALPVTDTARVAASLARFRGEILQKPPMYSALHHQGVRLYEYARKGVEIEREPRKVYIRHLELVETSADTLLIDVCCSKGTYIRVLAEDIGVALGCGASLVALTRTGVGDLELADARVRTLDQIAGLDETVRASCLLPVDLLVSALPALSVDADGMARLRMGQKITAMVGFTSGLARLYGPDTAFLGVADVSADGGIAPKRLISQSRAAQ
jgi:tRNA pseudouridine55 synthase